MKDMRFGFFWYNDDEIFRFNDSDFDNKAKKFSDAGINAVITFSCTHFRWTMYPYWEQINKCLSKIVKACHKHGIKVVEHHSSHLTFDPLDTDEWEYMERVLNKRHSSIESWEGIRDYLADDPVVGGKNISSFRQIDGRTGNWARTCYHGYGMCFNNPDYREAYFSYLEEVYKTGIDGIMADDVQLFGGGNACACTHCRRLFAESTGYELPGPGEVWHRFYGDYDNPVYIAWEKFRRQSTTRFQFDLNKHFEGLGYKLMRPNYVSSAIMNNWSAYPLDSAAEIWDFVFQENCYSNIIKYSWPGFAMEAIHRYALGERYSKPSMSHFYPDREDTYYFAWAMARSWGQLFLATPEGHDSNEYEKIYREFEKKHFELLFNCEKKADMAFYFSMKTRDYIKDSASMNMKMLYSWMQSAYSLNHSIDMVFENDDQNKLNRYPMIILPCVSMMDENEFIKLRRYVEYGGTLLIVGIPGERDENGIKRNVETLPQKFDITAVISEIEDEYENRCVADLDGKKVEVGMVKCRFCFKSIQNLKVVIKTDIGDVIGISSQFGEGKLIWILDQFGYDKLQGEVRAERWYTHEIRSDPPEYVFDDLKKIPGSLIEGLIEDRLINVYGSSEEFMISCFAKADKTGYAVHIVNVEGTLEKGSGSIGHSDLIPAFSKNIQKDSPEVFTISLRSDKGDVVSSIILYSPENDSEYILGHTRESDRLLIDIPNNIFKVYGVVDVRINGEYKG